MKTKFFESASGNRSSTRLIGFIVICAALLFAQQIIWFGRDEIMLAATAAGTIFVTVAGPVLAFIFAQKRTEVKQEGKPPENQS